MANFEGNSGPISALSFSENGYYLATAGADDGCVKLWDLRKLKNFKTIQLDEGYEVRDLSFDHTGTYLAVAGTDVRVYLCKQWTDLKVFQVRRLACQTAIGYPIGGQGHRYIFPLSLISRTTPLPRRVSGLERTPRTLPQPQWTGPSSFMDSKLSSKQNKPPTPVTLSTIPVRFPLFWLNADVE